MHVLPAAQQGPPPAHTVSLNSLETAHLSMHLHTREWTQCGGSTTLPSARHVDPRVGTVSGAPVVVHVVARAVAALCAQPRE